MKKVRIIARQIIISPTGVPYDDDGLKALDGYLEEIVSVEDDAYQADAEEAFIKKHHLDSFWNLSIEEVDE